MANVYRQRLEAELLHLTRKGIAIRNLLRTGRYGNGDALHQLAQARELRSELEHLDREKARLRHELGLPEPSPPVRIDPVAVSLAKIDAIRAETAARQAPRASVKIGTPLQNRRLADLRKRVEAGGYITRAMRGR
jgi:hypothetical protein